jgi:inosine/xanthosine triphosphate pyrophosphatase family protein
MGSHQRRSILLATGNADKQRMLRWLLDGLPFDPVTPAEIGVTASPDESGANHEEIAKSKAETWSLAAGIPAIASDGGLSVPALGANWESRYTRRFAGPAANDAERQRRLLELLAPYRGPGRAAAFTEGLAIADGARTLASWEVRGATGRIVDSLADAGNPTGDDGFWVFPLWYFAQFNRTYDRLIQIERASLGDHWDNLRLLVQGFTAGWVTVQSRGETSS